MEEAEGIENYYKPQSNKTETTASKVAVIGGGLVSLLDP